MKLVTYARDDGPIRTGVVLARGILDVSAWIVSLAISDEARAHNAAAGIEAPSGGVLRWLQSGDRAIDALAAQVARALSDPQARLERLDEVRLHAPVPRPGKIIGIGRNYADHARETGVAPFEQPRILFKAPSSVAAPGAPVSRPPSVTKMDFEAELAVVIGAYGKDVPAAAALSLVAGYTVLNDLSAREFQFDVAPAQTSFAKSMDGFAPMGPWLVTREEIADPQALDVRCWLNGQAMQHGHTLRLEVSGVGSMEHRIR